VGLAMAALLTRLPTRPLRYAAIAGFVVLNLAQAYGRVMIGNEPPMDRVGADVREDYRGETTLTFTPVPQNTRHATLTGAPGTEYILGYGGRYYFSFGDPRFEGYRDFARMNIAQSFNLRMTADPRAI